MCVSLSLLHRDGFGGWGDSSHQDPPPLGSGPVSLTVLHPFISTDVLACRHSLSSRHIKASNNKLEVIGFAEGAAVWRTDVLEIRFQRPR